MNAMKAGTFMLISCPQCLQQCLAQRRHLLNICWMSDGRKRRVALNLTQGRELPPGLASFLYSTAAFLPQTTVVVFSSSTLKSACGPTLLSRNLKELLFKLIPMAGMLTTLANTIPHVVTKHWHCSLLFLLPHSHIQLHCQMSSFCFQTHLKFVPCSSAPQPLSRLRFSSSLPWPTTTVSS